MARSKPYLPEGPSRAEVDAAPGATVVDFGTNWCGYCRAAEPFVTAAFDRFPNVAHVKVEDGKGLPLGRSFGIKQWPTLVFLADGREVARVTRPRDSGEIEKALGQLTRVHDAD